MRLKILILLAMSYCVSSNSAFTQTSNYEELIKGAWSQENETDVKWVFLDNGKVFLEYGTNNEEIFSNWDIGLDCNSSELPAQLNASSKVRILQVEFQKLDGEPSLECYTILTLNDERLSLASRRHGTLINLVR